MRNADQQPVAWVRAAVVASRCLVGLVLAYAGWSKLTHPLAEFIGAIDAYRILPTSSAIELAGILPWIELYTGVLLFFGYWTKVAAQVASFLFSAFLALLIVSFVRGIHPASCGCFGAAIHLTPTQAMGGDLVLLMLSLLIVKQFTPSWTLEAWLQRSTARMASNRTLSKTKLQAAKE